uniref:Uncharacterized protein n=1 Tax=Arundo donax TaxID=35708 RepID=A0A0A9E7M7_ARUDO
MTSPETYPFPQAPIAEVESCALISLHTGHISINLPPYWSIRQFHHFWFTTLHKPMEPFVGTPSMMPEATSILDTNYFY